MLFDLHVHTKHSPCSSLGLDQLLAHARARGLDGVCLTDHDTMLAGREVREGIQADGLCVIIGMEYATPQGDFLLFGPFEHLQPGLEAEELLALVDELQGAAVAAHPHRAGRATAEALVAGGCCRLVEVMNGRNSEQENQRVRGWLARYPLGVCGGSDAHSLAELGRAVTRFSRPIRNRQELVGALRAGACRSDWNSRYALDRLAA